MEVQVNNFIIRFAYFCLFFLVACVHAPKSISVPLVQKAFLVTPYTIVYSRPDFDSRQIHYLNTRNAIAISSKIYRPRHLFGTFYKVFINKPNKIRGYVSQVDVIPEYKKTKRGYTYNSEYAGKEDNVQLVKESRAFTQPTPKTLKPKKRVKSKKRVKPKKKVKPKKRVKFKKRVKSKKRVKLKKKK